MRSEFEIPEIMLPEIMFPDLMRIPNFPYDWNKVWFYYNIQCLHCIQK